MTLDEVRDRIAELLYPSMPEIADMVDQLRSNYIKEKLSTLDGIAALMPERIGELKIIRDNVSDGPLWYATWMPWVGGHGQFGKRCMGEGPTELEARTRLLLAVLEAERNPR